VPTFVGEVKNGQIILASAISVPGSNGPPRNSYPSLLDTGAQRTLISEKIVEETGLSAVGESEIVPASGQPVSAKVYRVGISIPITLGIMRPDGNPEVGT
jgi:predicted aspartyl protease